MTMLMTFSVNSVRVSSDMPVESEFLPMVTLYYILGISFVFLAFNWFILANEFSTKNNLPKCLLKCVLITKRIVFWKFNEKPFWLRRKNVSPSLTLPSKDKIFDDTSIKTGVPEIKLKEVKTCFNCDLCENCLKLKDAEKEKRSVKELNETNVAALNCFMFFILFTIMLGCNLIAWLLVTNPPANF